MTDGVITFLRPTQSRLQALNSIAETDGKHRLACVFQYIHNATSRVFQEDVPSVGKQVIFRSGTYRIDQALSEFALEKADHATNLLEGEAALSQLTDDRHFGKVIWRVMALMTATSRNHNSAFVQPLKLTQADAGQTGNVARCKVRLQVKDLETKVSANV